MIIRMADTAMVFPMVNLPPAWSSYQMLVEANANDGYRATFAWAELDSTFMDKAVYVVTKRDGKLLSEKAN
jgi:hypothetical protein